MQQQVVQLLLPGTAHDLCNLPGMHSIAVKALLAAIKSTACHNTHQQAQGAFEHAMLHTQLVSSVKRCLRLHAACSQHTQQRASAAAYHSTLRQVVRFLQVLQNACGSKQLQFTIVMVLVMTGFCIS